MNFFALILLSCLFPLLSVSPGWTQTCTETEIRANLLKLKGLPPKPSHPSNQNILQCEKDAIQPLISIVQNKQDDSEVRRNAAWALGQIGEGSPEVVQDLLAVLNDKQDDAKVRSSAAYTLRKIGEGSPEVVQALLAVLNDKQDDSSVRSSAAWALGQIGEDSPEVVKALLEVFKDKQDSIALRFSAASALGDIKEGSPEVVKTLVGVLNDKQDDSEVRGDAAYALGQIGEDSPEVVQVLLEVFKDKQDDSLVRSRAASALGQIGEGKPEVVQALLGVLNDKQDTTLVRMNAATALRLIGEGSPEVVQALLKVLNDKQNDKYVRGNAATALRQIGEGSPEVVKALLAVLNDKQDDSEVRSDVAWTLRMITSNLITETDNLSIQELEQWIELYKPILPVVQDINEVASDGMRPNIIYLERKLQEKKKFQILQITGLAILVHALFWTGLIFLYPKSPQVRATFFWNPKVRKIVGLWYVGLALTWVPFLRERLFEPFRESLLSDADLENFNPQTYFAKSPVQHEASGEIQPLNKAIPEINGQILLVGESGLGKSMFLRHLVQSSEGMVVYLPAYKCDGGVIAAIQEKLDDYVKQDPNFLQSLIYHRAIDICIDGLNEVTPDTQAKIIKFVESNFKANIIMTTQPNWTPLSTAMFKIYTLQPVTNK
ncbi:AAA domain family protein [Lyngbya aestuarii BL J]|uniref:AAA domain family protein n=1 Tax=Lyngbya aestuarii BL J TaxID=1348334 RepID=U7QCC5_9CYAN|nr:HEAT repeat domain-containing protein [Lyngbya aestuarii]ERT04867.1 AAA domain family protein [Lyngbya aestuarii BL J]